MDQMLPICLEKASVCRADEQVISSHGWKLKMGDIFFILHMIITVHVLRTHSSASPLYIPINVFWSGKRNIKKKKKDMEKGPSKSDLYKTWTCMSSAKA